MNFIEALEKYIHTLRVENYAPTTLKSYQDLTMYFIKWMSRTYPDMEVHDVATETLIEYSEHLLTIEKHKQSDSYRVDRNRAVRRYFRFLKKAGSILIDPSEALGEIKEPDALPKELLSKEELEKILQACDLDTVTGYRNYAVILTAFAGGLRRKELKGLTIYDFNFRESTLRVNLGKNSKDRVVPVGKRCRLALKEYLEKFRPKIAKLRGVDSMFLSLQGASISYESLGNIFKSTGKKAGVPRLHCHLLRHQSAVELIRGGMSIRYVQEFLAHSNLQTTQIYYSRLAPIDVKKAHEKSDPRKHLKLDEAVCFAPKKAKDVTFFVKYPKKQGKKDR